MTHVQPPVLHIMLGLTVQFYQEVEEIARRADGEELFTNEGITVRRKCIQGKNKLGR